MADGSKTAPPVVSPNEPAYGTLPPKALEKLFGVDTIVRNPDDPTDGVFDVIKDKKGVILCIRNPRSKRWLRYDKGTAQRLVDEAQNALVVDVPTLSPVRTESRTESRTSGRKRKTVDYSEQEDVGNMLLEAIEQEDVGEVVVKKTAVAVGETAQVVKVNRVLQKKDAKKNWRVAGAAVRFSLRLSAEQQRLREEEQSSQAATQEYGSHTGMTLDFDDFDI